ncbi:MAG TPA: acetyl-CoA carboxylase biotin carboxyl carrier protein [Methylomirabilota bacterium]|nr:acetyl-CoA carboxylase biotin carboxyl carrier protein [Methylomirabilota bacterium]
MAIEREDLKEILAAVATAGFDEFSLEIGDMKIRLTKQGVVSAASPPRATTVTEAPAPLPEAPARASTPPASRPAPVEALDGLLAVTAPLLGTFYRAPAPDAPPFVEVGSVVEPDDTVCIIEVMKLMNNVRAGRRGRVARICAENAALVEFGQTLVLIEPLP